MYFYSYYKQIQFFYLVFGYFTQFYLFGKNNNSPIYRKDMAFFRFFLCSLTQFLLLSKEMKEWQKNVASFFWKKLGISFSLYFIYLFVVVRVSVVNLCAICLSCMSFCHPQRFNI